MLKLLAKNVKTHQTNWSTNYFWSFLAPEIWLWITRNGNVAKEAKSLILKIRENTSKKLKLTNLLAGFRRLEPLCTAASNAIDGLAEEELNDRKIEVESFETYTLMRFALLLWFLHPFSWKTFRLWFHHMFYIFYWYKIRDWFSFQFPFLSWHLRDWEHLRLIFFLSNRM